MAIDFRDPVTDSCQLVGSPYFTQLFRNYVNPPTFIANALGRGDQRRGRPALNKTIDPAYVSGHPYELFGLDQDKPFYDIDICNTNVFQIKGNFLRANIKSDEIISPTTYSAVYRPLVGGAYSYLLGLPLIEEVNFYDLRGDCQFGCEHVAPLWGEITINPVYTHWKVYTWEGYADFTLTGSHPDYCTPDVPLLFATPTWQVVHQVQGQVVDQKLEGLDWYLPYRLLSPSSPALPVVPCGASGKHKYTLGGIVLYLTSESDWSNWPTYPDPDQIAFGDHYGVINQFFQCQNCGVDPGPRPNPYDLPPILPA